MITNSRNGKLAHILNLLSIMMLYVYCCSGGYESSAMQTCMDAWPTVSETSIRMMMTLPAIIQGGLMLLLGPLFGRKLRYKTSAVIGLFLISIGGLLPVFWHPTWNAVLLCRGIGLGGGAAFLGMRNALLLESVPAADGERWIGYGSAALSFSTVIFGPLVGWLAAISWNYAFLINGGAVLCLILSVFCLREPACPVPKVPKDKQKWSLRGMDSRVLFYGSMFFTITCVFSGVAIGLSTFLAEQNAGTSGLAGICMSIFSLIGFLMNLILTKITHRLKRFSFSFFVLTCIIGIVLMLMWPSRTTAMFGMAMCGIGYYPAYSLLQVYNCKVQPSEQIAFSSVLILLANQIAVLAATLLISLCGKLGFQNSDVSSFYLCSVIALLVLFAIGLLPKFVPENRKGTTGS